MIYILLTILCSTSIVLILKHSETKNGHPLILLAGNYVVASFISLFFYFTESGSNFSIESLIFGAAIGLLFMLSFFSYAKAIAAAGPALASVSARISVGLPVILAILIFNETPGSYQLAGFGLTIVTLIFFYFSLKKVNRGHIRLNEYFYLFFLFAIIGITDFAMKIFNTWRPLDEKPFFLFIIFSFAFLFTIGFIKVKKIQFERRTFGRGLLLGIPNIFSTFFLLNALYELPAILVYPIVNIGIILLTAFSATILWGEKLNTSGKWALAVGACAILLLSIN